MKQVIQNFKTGKLYVDELPAPSLSTGMVLVENKFSLISAGTERSTTKVAQASLLGKAKQRPDLVKQVIQNIKKEGLAATLEKVNTKLDSLKALGYSTAGVVAASQDKQNFFRPGDRVACAGAGYASHAEVVAIPQNLVVKIPDNVSFEEASFVTLGAIALQGVRQADAKLGDNVCVIGLGLLGQLTCQLLKANGCNVLGIDVSQRMSSLAVQTGAVDASMLRSDGNLVAACNAFTKGFGFDSVIITAAAPQNNDPIELSSEILRKKGNVVVVGAVKMDIPREPHFYRKELELRMSCSYGPGRYDYLYEEAGIDYPYAYVRWTEQRNMEAFVRLISKGTIKLAPLISHVFDISDAEKAYDLVMGKVDEPSIGILLRYSEVNAHTTKRITVNTHPQSEINLAAIGAGSFAQSYLIPTARSFGASLDSVVTSTGINAKNVAGKFGFNHALTDARPIFHDGKINTIFIATRHDSHAAYVVDGLRTNKNVFVEKPLAMTIEELIKVAEVYEEMPGPKLMVGFNRRFAPTLVKAKSVFANSNEPKVITYRVNAGFIPKDHWTQDPGIGGGRIIGEVCHFVDLMQFITDSLPISVFADCIQTQNDSITNADNVAIIIKFADGSIGNIIYVANGDKSLPKERIEISGAGRSVIVDDFKKINIFSKNRCHTHSAPGKGHKEEVQAFLQSIKTGSASPIAFDSLFTTTLATFKILDAIQTGLPQSVSL